MPIPHFSSSSHNVTATDHARLGWVGQCNQRGTIDILWNCLSTIFISLWVMLHLNVPAVHEGFWTSFFRKTRWLILGALAPETVLLASGGQWASAKRSLTDMRALGAKDWTLVHGFYADSGGFVLHTQDSSPFPVTAKQVHYLVKEKYLSLPDISEKEIFDKSKGEHIPSSITSPCQSLFPRLVSNAPHLKEVMLIQTFTQADQFTKTIACLQTGWFVTECIGRAIQKLPISPLELCTCAIILCTVAVYYFWLYKPLNVTTPTTLTVDCSIATILVRAGTDAEKPFWNTPLDFVEPTTVYTFGNWPSLAKRWGPYRKPFVRIPNDRNPQLYGVQQRIVYSLLVVFFSTISFAEWYFDFPSSAEKLIWRTACIAAEASLFVHAIAEAVSHHAPPHDYLYIEGYKLHWPQNILFFAPGATYFAARMALIAVAFSSLRSLPAESYVNLQWTTFIPHL
ncbi:MAG: hypothetical protein L6R40_004288 [Gallowayella cf. fulva]|nr:MAG: hypothetical protein L6R40_004288 [Xanthomendoza cf. fulva]